MNLTDPILRHARMQPRSVALIEREQTTTYDELADRILRTAGYLAKLGIVRGDHDYRYSRVLALRTATAPRGGEGQGFRTELQEP